MVIESSSLTASDNLKFRFATDGEGNYGYLGADDSFVPFKKGGLEVLIPDMTGNTAPSGVASSSSTYSSSYPAWKAFDGIETDSEDRWASSRTDTDCWLQYKFDTPVKATRLELLIGIESSYNYNFTLQGSNNGSTWSNIYSSTVSVNRNQKYRFSNANYYTYYRLKLSGGNASTGYTITAMQLYGERK